MLPPWPAYPDATGPLPIFDYVVSQRYPRRGDQDSGAAAEPVVDHDELAVDRGEPDNDRVPLAAAGGERDNDRSQLAADGGPARLQGGYRPESYIEYFNSNN
jgi:hypothetical protein